MKKLLAINLIALSLLSTNAFGMRHPDDKSKLWNSNPYWKPFHELQQKRESFLAKRIEKGMTKEEAEKKYAEEFNFLKECVDNHLKKNI